MGERLYQLYRCKRYLALMEWFWVDKPSKHLLFYSDHTYQKILIDIIFQIGLMALPTLQLQQHSKAFFVVCGITQLTLNIDKNILHKSAADVQCKNRWLLGPRDSEHFYLRLWRNRKAFAIVKNTRLTTNTKKEERFKFVIGLPGFTYWQTCLIFSFSSGLVKNRKLSNWRKFRLLHF